MTLRGMLPMLLLTSVALAACTPPAAGSSAPASPSAAPPASTPPAPVTPSASPSRTPPKPAVTKAGLAYFFSIALGSEYGAKSAPVIRWTKPRVTVRVHGKPTKSARTCLDKVVTDFNALSRSTDLALTTGPADIDLHFAPLATFKSLEPDYVTGNDGFVHVEWNGFSSITRANVLIRSSGLSPGIRCHLIREELTQGMGLLRDSNKYPGSIFYGRYLPAPTRYSKLDKEVIRLLYSDAVRPGDDKAAVTRAVRVTGS
ncbi:DUF2927 domain-containing protein [Actinoplanes sp. RD1]|uniref:DUF2927 domain-containing protein n=1 Tax=Actinoplanes sp. RD1 TaxID=3064538 RepID=UPI00274203F4|nr:DUF2927 domain-containing protein [Actinoplanes sp. RD1]